MFRSLFMEFFFLKRLSASFSANLEAAVSFALKLSASIPVFVF